MVSAPPMCTQAFFWMLWKLPPQYVNFDEAHPFPKDCPRSDCAFALFDMGGMHDAWIRILLADGDLDGTEDPELYDASAGVGLPARATSPIMSEAYAIKGKTV